MNLRCTLTSLAILLWALVSPREGRAQYMFLDTNGDSTSSSADTLAYPGENHVRVWLVTNRNRDGSIASCSGGTLSLNSYEFILRASGAGVVWEEYTNLQTAMSLPVGNTVGGTDIHRGYAGTEALSPGKYCLGTLAVTIAAPGLSIQIVPDSPLSGAYGTSFGSDCAGRDADNTLKLGVDWFDVDGLGTSSALAGEGYSGVVSTTSVGTLYLGGNHLDPPYDLSYVNGQFTVNGLSLPLPAAPTRNAVAYTEEQQSQMALFQRLATVADSLHKAGVGSDEVGSQLLNMCQSSSLIDSVALASGSLAWKYRDGTRASITLMSDILGPPPISRATIERRELEHLRDLIDAGSTVFIISKGNRLLIPKSHSARIESIVQRLRAGETLTGDDAARMPQELKEQLRDPVLLVRVK